MVLGDPSVATDEDDVVDGAVVHLSLLASSHGNVGSLASSSQPSMSSLVPLSILLVLVLELVDKVVNHSVVEVLASKMVVSSSGLDLKDALLEGKDRRIKGSASKIEDENVVFSGSLLLVQSVSDGGSDGLVNDTENVKTSYDTRVLGGVHLRVV